MASSWASAMANTTVYVGGSFTTARPDGAAAGQNTVPRSNLLAFNVTTGQLLSFSPNPTFNGQIRAMAVSPDKTRLYVGGEFTTVNGQPRSRIAAFNINVPTAALSLVDNFAPPVNYHVRAVTATNSTVYAGGDFIGCGQCPAGVPGRLQRQQRRAARLGSAGHRRRRRRCHHRQPARDQGRRGRLLHGAERFQQSRLWPRDGGCGSAAPACRCPSTRIVRNGTTDGAIDNFTTDGTYVYGSGWTFGRCGGTMEGVFAAPWDGGGRALHQRLPR